MKENSSIVSQLDYLRKKILPIVEQQIRLLPVGQLDNRPASNSMSLDELAFHVLNSSYIYLKGVELGGVNKSLFQDLNLDLESDRTLDPLLTYCSRFSSYLDRLARGLRVQKVSNLITYSLNDVGWGTWSLSSDEAVQTAIEEKIHHRGQLSLYLRLLGIIPPKIYSYL